MAKANGAANGERMAEPEVMTMTEAFLNYANDPTHENDIVIVIPDDGNSIFVPSKEYVAKVDGNSITRLSRPRYDIVKRGSYKAEPFPRGFVFENGKHAGKALQWSLEIFAMETNGGPAKVEETETEHPNTETQPAKSAETSAEKADPKAAKK